MEKKCLWCFESEPEESFKNKAHTIPKSLGGENYNKNVCDSCNKYFGSRVEYNYSIEEALKETFNIPRRVMLMSGNPKKQVGKFKSRYFDIRIRNGKRTLKILPQFRNNRSFQQELCRAFKRGLYKMVLEELNRQKEIGYESEYDLIRLFSRYNKHNLPVIYFNRAIGVFLTTKREAETPVLIFDRMQYLYSNDKFIEIEFLGQVFGFPIKNFSEADYDEYLEKSLGLKKGHFINAVIIEELTDIDIAMKVMQK